MKILAVDDDEIVLNLLRASLEATGLGRVTTVTSAAEALAEIANAVEPFECFLLDIVMPEVDGITLCATIRRMQRYCMTPIIMVSALPKIDNMEAAFAAGATDYVRKPFDGLELGTRMNIAAMMNARLRQAHEDQRQMSILIEEAGRAVGVASALQAEGIVDFLALENYLLRLPAGCFAMSLVGFEVACIASNAASSLTAVDNALLDRVGEAISWAMPRSKFLVSYVSEGQFVGVVTRRGGLEQAHVQRLLNDQLTDMEATCDVVARLQPQVSIFKLSRLRVMSGRQALSVIENFVETRVKVPSEPAFAPVAKETKRLFRKAAAEHSRR